MSKNGMPPTPQEPPHAAPPKGVPPVAAAPLKDDDVVISGLSGLFPNCHNLKEFSEKLYKHENLVCGQKVRWNIEHPELTKYVGNIPDIDRFDAQFFMVHHHLANRTDVMSKKLLEHTYQAIFDAGTTPTELSGKKVAVFIGVSLTESDKLLMSPHSTGMELVGCNRAMFSNRISYWLNAKGPSLTIDASCSASMVCMEKAYEAMMRGDCEAAIVGGCNVHVQPQSCIHYARLFGKNPDGKTKSFDKHSDGQSPSECISVVFLQKAKDAKRMYASVCNVKTQYGLQDDDYLDRFGPCRDPYNLSSFYKEFYEDSNNSPQDVEYVEAFGSANPEADKNELEAIEEVFCKNRNNPLYVGSVMSNMGFSNAATTVAAVTKVCLAYQTGKIAANLHYTTPRDDVPAISDGRMRVVTHNTDFTRSYAAINSLSLTGVNGHMLLKGQYKPKDLSRYESKLPYLLTVSGRQESAVEFILKDMKSNPVDPEVIALFHEMQKSRVSKHMARGYAILTSDENERTVCVKEKVDYFDDAKRPLWFVYSGMGSQWNGMGKELMRIPVFASAIKRCHQVLGPKGLDIVHIITTTDKTIFDNVMNCFVGITACQIGLTDVLLSMGLVPDNIIGHSMGEMGCAYGDGCITAEEYILAAYYRGRVSTETPFIKGTMAAVGLGWQKIQSICPPEVLVGCHNSPESCTISGPFDIMSEFIDKLNNQGIFARAVNSSNIAYHSRYIAEGVPVLLEYLKSVITTPKPRSKKWISTSVPKERWDEPSAKMNSAEYHANNMRVPVLFEEAAEMIPSNAVLIEVAPHGLLQAILKRAYPACINVPLTRRGHPDNAIFLLEALGDLYLAGYNPDLSVLYPKVEFPVSTETRSLSHMIEWVHDEKWKVPTYIDYERMIAFAYDTTFSTYDDEYSFLRGHIINSETVFPVSSALVSVWDTLAMAMEVKKKNIAVQFNDVHIHAQPLVFDRLFKVGVEIQRGTGWFEVVNENILVATGYVKAVGYTSSDYMEKVEDEEDDNMYTSNDIYSILHDRGYGYRGEFRSILNLKTDMTKGVVSWTGNWVTLIDAAIQMNVIRQEGDVIVRPRFIQQLNIDVKQHYLAFKADKFGNTLLNADHFEVQKITRCGGIVINNILFTSIPLRRQNKIAFKNLKSVQTDCKKLRGVSLKSSKIGDFESLHWREMPEPKPEDCVVSVHYAGLNSYDSKKSIGDISTSVDEDSCQSYGMDFSGLTASGVRVMGVVREGAASSLVSAEPKLLWPVPDHWSLEDACTVPLAYAHALYCLGIKCKLHSGMSVLVHGAAGALGQAIISIALANQCTIFATVSNIKKKQQLRRIFPDIPDNHFGNSRHQSFGDLVLAATEGKGCDIVVSCLKGGLKDISLSCCAAWGTTLDTHSVHSKEEFTYSMSSMTSCRSYCTTDFSTVFEPQNYVERQQLQVMVSEGIARGFIRPLSHVTFGAHQSARAMRLLATSQNFGRVLLRIHGEDFSTTNKRLAVRADGSHLVLSATTDNAVAIRIVDLLIHRGAVNIVLEQHNNYDAFLQYKIRHWQKLGARVKVSCGASNDKTKYEELVKMCNRLNPIDSLFAIVSGTSDKEASLLANLDNITRKFCTSMRMFAVVSENADIGCDTCIKRVQDGFPAIMLQLPKIDKFNTSNDTIKEISNRNPVLIRHVMPVLENTLCSSSVVAAVYIEESDKNLVKEISEIAHLKDEADDHVTIKELDLKTEQMQELMQLLQKYDVTVTRESVQESTIAELKTQQDTSKQIKAKRLTGLEVLLSSIETDELKATTDLVFLPTAAQKFIDNAYDLDDKATFLFMIPGIYGQYKQFETVCERLKVSAVVVQPGLEHIHETVSEMAERLVKIILKKFWLRGKFYLLGYSFGVLVALKMAAILEEHGLTGIVYCVDASPDAFPMAVESLLREADATDVEQLQNAIVLHTHAILTDSKSEQLKIKLQQVTTWNDKVEAGVQALGSTMTHSMQYFREILEAAYTRISQARQYDPKPLVTLRSQIVLLRSHSNTHPSSDLGLARHSENKCHVYELSSDHATALDDLRCANIINRYLDEQVLAHYNKKNLCNTYPTNL